jgi:hypothetical protein
MRIAFDLDGTLIPGPDSPMALERLGALARAVWHEPIRAGAPALLRGLSAHGHEVWLYTTSLRSPTRMRLWFACFGVRLGGVVNQAKHRAVLARGRVACSKYPPAFGIDLLIDDSEGVVLEAARYRFSVLRIDPQDSAWCARVEQAVEAARAAAAA